MFGFAPWKGKSIAVQTLVIAFALLGRKPQLQLHPGRCLGLMALSPFRGIMQTVGLIPFKHLYIHRVRGVYRTAIFLNLFPLRLTHTRNWPILFLDYNWFSVYLTPVKFQGKIVLYQGLVFFLPVVVLKIPDLGTKSTSTGILIKNNFCELLSN